MIKKLYRNDITTLLIDDDPSCLAVLELMLHRMCRLVKAGSSLEALNILSLASRQVNQILLDIDMPGMSGLELLAIIKNQPDSRHIPVILQTASDDISISKGLALGADAVLRKPFTKLQLFATMDTVFNKHSPCQLERA